jgi:hypothetical protein
MLALERTWSSHGSVFSLGHKYESDSWIPYSAGFAEVAIQRRRDKRRKWRIFGIGLAVRLFGVILIWLGDGSPAILRKVLVVLGVILSIGGITVLRYLLISGFRKKK